MRVSTLFLFDQKTRPGPHMNRQKRFREFFLIRKDIRENRKVCKTVFACSCGTQVEPFKQNKNCQESRDTVSLSSSSHILIFWGKYLS